MWLVAAFLAHWFLYSLAGVVVVFLLRGIRYIPNTKVGLVEKRASRKGSVTAGIIALNGESGFQPALLRGGVHYLLPWQRKILREGTFAINLAQFVVITTDRVYFLPLEKSDVQIFQRMTQVIQERSGFDPVVIKGTDDLVGIVTVHDGPSLPPGQIIAPTVGDDAGQANTYHNSFQDPERFLRAGGQRGRQLQVLVEGTYYINRLFATVETVPKTVIEVGNVGVVVSYTGEVGQDLSGTDYKHGELVQKGLRGVWSEALLPGKRSEERRVGKECRSRW